MTTQQQTERERLAEKLENFANKGNKAVLWEYELRRAAALLRGDEPSEPDRYMQAWKEAEEVWRVTVNTDGQDDQAAAAVLRRHFSEKPCQKCGFLPDSTG